MVIGMIFAIQLSKKKAKLKFLYSTQFFGFDLFYFMKTYIAAAWCSKELNVGGTNLTHANYLILVMKLNLLTF